MACRALTTPCGAFPAGGAALPAFCPSSTSSFAALARQQQPRSRAAAATSSVRNGNGSLVRTSSRRRGRSEVLRCGLTRLSGDAGHRVLPVLATRDQWSHYWGGSDVQRVGKFFEVTAVAFLGLWACYFASFFLGVATMTVIGTSFLFYWLLAPNVTSFRRNRALRGRIAPFPGAEGNSVAIFRARVASATEEYHPVTGQPVFLRMVIEDEDGRALKFRTRTRAEYARVRRGMVAEAILVSPDERFDEILGVSDTYIPAANVWVGEYPYLDKVVMRRLLASRDLKRRQRRREAGGGGDGDESFQGYDGKDYDDEDEDEELDPMTYRDSWTQTWPKEEPAERENDGAGAASPPPPQAAAHGSHVASRAYGSDFDAYYGRGEEEEEEDEAEVDEPYFEGVGSAGFSKEADGSSAGRSSGRQRWERVSGRPRPRRRPVRGLEGGEGGDGGLYSGGGGRRARGEASLRREWDAGNEGRPTRYGGESVDDSRLAADGRRAGR